MSSTKHPLHSYRKERKLSLEDVAKLFEVDKATVSRWERSVTSVPAERAVEIERKLGIPRAWLRPDLFGAA